MEERDGLAQQQLKRGLRSALKEWAVTVRALEEGIQTILLRKGGIAEKGLRFEPRYQDFLLFPTFEHQNRESIKDRYHALLEETLRYPARDSRVPISSWACVESAIEVNDIDALLELEREHIWTREEVRRRFEWKPERPLYLLILRVHRLRDGVELDLLRQYGGCRSWIEVGEPISSEGSKPVLGEEEFDRRVESIKKSIGG